MVVVVMPLSLVMLHIPLSRLSLTSGTLILLLLTTLFSLGSHIGVPIALSIESSLYLNFYFTPPFHSFRIADPDDVTTLIIFLIATTSVAALVRVIGTNQSQIAALRKKLEKIGMREIREKSSQFALGQWTIDFDVKSISIPGDENRNLHLTPIEWKLLETLVRGEGKLIPQQEVLRLVWGEKYKTETNYLRLYLSQLRKKIEESPKKPLLLLTEAGHGYRAISQRIENEE
jgi:DNA-binding winged helix-turn-helix (wHTH) protein